MNPTTPPVTTDRDLDPRPAAPEAPQPGDCCHSGCAYCVEDLYTEALYKYREELAAWLARHPDAPPVP
ncbi:MAG: oxidoreductase-like domain-containing protein [Burkholderiaceae bacterium]|nr:oxidoreductase-like domain-containing protein [Burkholderiaceae bacterium]